MLEEEKLVTFAVDLIVAWGGNSPTANFEMAVPGPGKLWLILLLGPN